jgi:septal ring factor EnvC (AmiA/AmiB activator)
MKKIFLFLCVLSLCDVFAEDIINQKLDRQSELINDIETQISEMNQTITSLKFDKLNMENNIIRLENSNQNMSEKIEFLKSNNDELHSALISNKEDTSEVINVLGGMSEDLMRVNQQRKLADKFIQFSIPITTIPLIVGGAYLYFATDEKDLGKVLMISGGVLLVGCELVWNGGKFVLKIW